MRLDQLQQLVTEWASRNFPNAHAWEPLIGMCEEVGELFHAHLKAHQGIRGSAAEHHAAKIDSVGDAMIYLAHYCALSKLNLANRFDDCLQLNSEEQCGAVSHQILALRIQVAAGKMADDYCFPMLDSKSKEKSINAFLIALVKYCQSQEIELCHAVETTWAQVSKRDWQKNKDNGNV